MSAENKLSTDTHAHTLTTGALVYGVFPADFTYRISNGVITAYGATADIILFDARAPADSSRPGGNGAAFDWRTLIGAGAPFALSGGLTPDNVAEAIRVTGATMVDVSSGVERRPGVKDHDLIRRFIHAAKSV